MIKAIKEEGLNIEYASDERVLEEFDFSDKIMRKLGCKTIDVTQRAIEDTALIIMEHVRNSKYN